MAASRAARSGSVPRASRILLFLLGLAAMMVIARLIPGPDPKEAPGQLRVQVLLTGWGEAETVPLRVNGRYRLVDREGRTTWSGASFDGALKLGEAGVRMGAIIPPGDHFELVPEGDAALRIDQEWYRGRLVVDASNRRPETGRRKLQLFLDLPLEDYVLGVVCGELPTAASGAEEAIKAQAIAARSWALWELRAGRHFLRDDAADQHYVGIDFESIAAREAVRSTSGLVLTWDGELLHAYYHAECGGGTADAHRMEFSREPIPPLSGAADLGCAEAWPWELRVAPVTLDALAVDHGLGGHLRRIKSTSRDGFGRLERVLLAGEYETLTVSGEDLRHLLGATSMLWTDVREDSDGSLLVTGRGRGHGVGMCQTGALHRARSGSDCAAILAHYYPGAEVVPIAEQPELIDS